MRVALLLDVWFPYKGGGVTHVYELCKYLIQNHNCKIDIFTRAYKDEKGKVYTKNETHFNGKLNVFRIPPATSFRNLIGRLSYPILSFLLINQKYDIINIHAKTAGFIAVFFKLFKNLPTILTVHGSLIGSKSRYIEEQIEKFLILGINYDHIISVNKQFVNYLRKFGKKASYIPTGICLDPFLRYRYNNFKRKDIFFIGRLEKQKAVDTLIEAMKYVTKEKPHIKLKIAGTGPEEIRLKELTKKLGLLNNIKFLGEINDKEKLKNYFSSEIFVLPSIWEGQPLSLLEAWASNLPAVVTNASGTREIAKHMENAYVVEVKNPKKLAEGILFLLNNKKISRRLAKNGSKDVKRFKWEVTAREVYKIYKKVISSKH